MREWHRRMPGSRGAGSLHPAIVRDLPVSFPSVSKPGHGRRRRRRRRQQILQHPLAAAHWRGPVGVRVMVRMLPAPKSTARAVSRESDAPGSRCHARWGAVCLASLRGRRYNRDNKSKYTVVPTQSLPKQIRFPRTPRAADSSRNRQQSLDSARLFLISRRYSHWFGKILTTRNWSANRQHSAHCCSKTRGCCSFP